MFPCHLTMILGLGHVRSLEFAKFHPFWVQLWMFKMDISYNPWEFLWNFYVFVEFPLWNNSGQNSECFPLK